jgi:hypothetical protein
MKIISRGGTLRDVTERHAESPLRHSAARI